MTARKTCCDRMVAAGGMNSSVGVQARSIYGSHRTSEITMLYQSKDRLCQTEETENRPIQGPAQNPMTDRRSNSVMQEQKNASLEQKKDLVDRLLREHHPELRAYLLVVCAGSA